MPQKKSEDKPVYRNPIHSAKEQKQNRFVVIGFIVIAALIVGLIAYAFLYEGVLKNNIAVAKVNGTEIDNKYFQDRVRLERNSYIQQFLLLSAQSQFVASDPASLEYYQNQLTQIQTLLDGTEEFGKLVLDKTIDDEILAQQAESKGIEVTDAEVNEALQGLFEFFPKGTPTPAPTFAPYTTPSLSKQQEAILKYTPTPNATAVATQELPQATPTPLPETAEVQPTATLYTEELYKQNYQEYVTSMADIDISEESLRTYMYHYLLNQKVFSEVSKDVTKDQEQVWARHILVKTQAEAVIVLDRLNKGEDWAAIAAEVSLDTSNKDDGGDLGWFSRGRMVKEFEDAAFGLEEGKISDPVETQFGWHIIQIIGHKTFALSETDYRTSQETVYTVWFNSIKETAEININDVYKELTPAEPAIPESNRIN
jgi:peptidyl-prolyl cis-trans isomerase D